MTRFSLRSILLIVLVVALAIAHGLLLFRHDKLQREVTQLRGEVGHLEVVDKSLVNVIAVPTVDRFQWRWRVYAPPGTMFKVGILTKAIPENGVSDQVRGSFELSSSELGELVTLSVTPDQQEGYQVRLDFGRGTSWREFTDQPLEEWLTGSSMGLSSVQPGVQAFPYGRPIILVKQRLLEPVSPTVSSSPTGPSRGFLVWITPIKTPSSLPRPGSNATAP